MSSDGSNGRNAKLALGDMPGWDNHNHAGFADAGLDLTDFLYQMDC